MSAAEIPLEVQELLAGIKPGEQRTVATNIVARPLAGGGYRFQLRLRRAGRGGVHAGTTFVDGVVEYQIVGVLFDSDEVALLLESGDRGAARAHECRPSCRDRAAGLGSDRD